MPTSEGTPVLHANHDAASGKYAAMLEGPANSLCGEFRPMGKLATRISTGWRWRPWMHGCNTQSTSREQSGYDTVKLEENIFVEITGGVQEGHPFTHQIHTHSTSPGCRLSLNLGWVVKNRSSKTKQDNKTSKCFLQHPNIERCFLQSSQHNSLLHNDLLETQAKRNERKV